MLKEVHELLDDHQTGMSDYQDDYLVTQRAGGTLYGQYKQALRELYRRIRGLRELICDREKLKAEIDELRYNLFEKVAPADINLFTERKDRIEFRRKTAQLEEGERACSDCARELTRFYQQAKGLKKEIGAITPVRRRELEHAMWEYRAREMAALDLLSTGRVGKTAIDHACVLPDEARGRVLAEMFSGDEHKALLDWYCQRHDGAAAPLQYEELPVHTADKLIDEVRNNILQLEE